MRAMGSSNSRGRRHSGGKPERATLDPAPPAAAMWSKGFDASPFSPAGQLQREAALFDGLASGSTRSRKAIALLAGALVVFVVIILIGWGISALAH
jgi:hypothetical protein